MTAAHCLRNVSSKDDILVYLNQHEVPSALVSKRPVGVLSFVIHPEYQMNNSHKMYNDMAIIRLQNPMNTTEVTPVCLSSSDSDIESYNQTLFVTGYGVQGQNIFGRLVGPLVLQEAQTTLITREACKRQYPSMELPSSKQFCAGNSKSGWTCSGDSGGPVSIRKNGKVVQVGIVSFGPQACNTNGFTHANVFEKISGHLEFIRKHTKVSRICSDVSKKKLLTNTRRYLGDHQERLREDQLLSCVCGDNSRSRGNRKPWHVILESTDYSSYNSRPLECDGIVISDRHIISPIECVDNRRLFVRRGVSESSSKMSVRTVHVPNHRRRFAVIELNEPMTFDDEFGPICLANFDTRPGDLLTAEGIEVSPQTVRQRRCYNEDSTVCTECVDDRDFIVTEKDRLEYLIGVDEWFRKERSCWLSNYDSKFAKISDFYSFIKDATREAKWCPSRHHLIASSSSRTNVCQCGLERTVPRIGWSGSAVSRGKYPWIVSVVNKNVSPVKGCAGTLISDRHILTAARCLDKVTYSSSSLDKLEVTMNAYTDEERQRMPMSQVDRIFKHPKYNARNFEYDIAIIKLRRPLPRDDRLVTICLPTAFSSRSTYRFQGWGFSANKNNNGVYGSKNLNEITVKRYDDSYCKTFFGSLFNSQDICAGQCVSSVGDGGSPLSEVNSRGRYIQVGVSQATYPGCEKGVQGPDSFESVFKNIDWIQETIYDGQLCNDAFS